MGKPLPAWARRLLPTWARRVAITVGGRRWRVADPELTTMKQHQAQVAELALLISRLEPKFGEQPAAFLLRAMAKLNESGRLIELTSLFLLPDAIDEADWTPSIGERVAQELQTLTGPAATRQLAEVALQFVAAYIESTLKLLALDAGKVAPDVDT